MNISSLPRERQYISIQHRCEMTVLEKVRELLAELTPGEKAQTLQWLVRDLTSVFPGVESSPDVAGGEACLVRTRIPVWVLVQARKLGSSEAEILQAYPSLRAEDLINAWAYYDAHKAEIAAQIAENEAA
jgi:uncharacterized protein (DUF433 family)